MALVNGHDEQDGLKETTSSKCCGGWQKTYVHDSVCTNSSMTFSIYLPPQAEENKLPVVYCLAGWMCNYNTFPERSGLQTIAAELGLIVVTPDTSPRLGQHIDIKNPQPGESASFYVDATELPWSEHFQMYTYITKELPELIEKHFPVIPGRKSIMGHSMGGHGALISFFRNPGEYQSVSALAPSCNPSASTIGEKLYSVYLGTDIEKWKEYDATELIRKYTGPLVQLLIDQGSKDRYAKNLLVENLRQACEKEGYPVTINIHEGYGHSFYFVSSFIKAHLEHHARHLLN